MDAIPYIVLCALIVCPRWWLAHFAKIKMLSIQLHCVNCVNAKHSKVFPPKCGLYLGSSIVQKFRIIWIGLYVFVRKCVAFPPNTIKLTHSTVRHYLYHVKLNWRTSFKSKMHSLRWMESHSNENAIKNEQIRGVSFALQPLYRKLYSVFAMVVCWMPQTPENQRLK